MQNYPVGHVRQNYSIEDTSQAFVHKIRARGYQTFFMLNSTGHENEI